MEHIWNDHKDHPSQHENSHKLCNEMGHPLSEFDRKSMETEITAWSQFPYDGKVIAEQKLVPKERNSKEQDWESQSGAWRETLTIRVRSFITVHLVYQFHQNRLARPYDGY